MYVDWPAGIIHVLKTDMVLVQTSPPALREVYQLDTDWMRLALRQLEVSTQGRAWPHTHDHNTTVQVSGAILARVLQITDDYTITFENDSYAVNLVGSNNNIQDRSNVNLVSIRPSNSAGLQDLNSLQAASFDGVVALKESSVYSGRVFPVGTRKFPVNNLHDVHEISEDRGIPRILIMESMSFAQEDMEDGYLFTSDNPVTVTIDVQSSMGIENAIFENVTVTGILDGSNIFGQCHLIDIGYVSGFVFQCAFTGSLSLVPGAQASIFDCYSNVAGGGPGQAVNVDCGGSGSLALRNYSGGMNLSNVTGGGDISMDFASGRLMVEASCTAGDIYVRGICDVTDNSGPGCTVHDYTVNAQQQQNYDEIVLIRKIMRNKKITFKSGPNAGKMIIYDDDGNTVLFEALVYEDDQAGIPYRGSGAERQERLE